MQEIHYPRRDVSPQSVFTQATLDRITAYMLSWRQGPGMIGGLHLHSCWNIKTVLRDGYQGQTTYLIDALMQCAIELFDRTADLFWQHFATDLTSNLLLLQDRPGGFIHAGYENEPRYDCGKGGAPIHQFMPVLALLHYADWKHAEPSLKQMIRPALERHWAWFQSNMWRVGNVWRSPLDHAGWCGVANQDLVVIAALAEFARIYGDAKPFGEFGKPALEALLKPGSFHQSLGVFERGDKPSFVERTYYHLIIVQMLQKIDRFESSPLLSDVISQTIEHLFDSAFEDTDGNLQLAWGIAQGASLEEIPLQWQRKPLTVSAYPGLIGLVQSHLAKHPNMALDNCASRLEQTVAVWTYSDGTLPGALDTPDPIFSLIPSRDLLHFWLYLIRNVRDLKSPPRNQPVACIYRTLDECLWKSNHRHWMLIQGGECTYAGFKPESRGIVAGPKPQLAGVNFASLDAPNVVEYLSHSPAAAAAKVFIEATV